MTCPCCHTPFPVEAGVNDVLARNTVKRIADLTPFTNLLLSYVRLFQTPSRVLPWDKAIKILDQITPMIKEGKIEHGGRTWPAPQIYWQQAIQQMLDTREQLRLPLKHHKYLLTIIAGTAGEVEKKTETQTEARKQGGVTRRQQDPEPKTTKMPDEVKEQLNQFLNKSIVQS